MKIKTVDLFSKKTGMKNEWVVEEGASIRSLTVALGEFERKWKVKGNMLGYLVEDIDKASMRKLVLNEAFF